MRQRTYSMCGRAPSTTEVKTETSEAPLPLPDLCVAALKIRKKQQDAGPRSVPENGWIGPGLVFTTRYGTPIEPRNFNGVDRCMVAARVARITVPTAPARPVPRCWLRWMSTRESPCASCGTANRRHDGDLHRSPVRCHPRRAPQAQRLARMTVAAVCCCRRSKGPVPGSEPAFDLRGAEGIRTPDPLHAMEVRSQLRYSPARTGHGVEPGPKGETSK